MFGSRYFQIRCLGVASFRNAQGDDRGHVNGILGNAGVSMNRTLYVVLWVIEVLMIVGLVVAIALPVQDNALREYIQWQQHPSPETYRAFLEKQRQISSLRLTIAFPCGITALLLAGPLRKHRRKA